MQLPAFPVLLHLECFVVFQQWDARSNPVRFSPSSCLSCKAAHCQVMIPGDCWCSITPRYWGGWQRPVLLDTGFPRTDLGLT